MPFDSLGLNTLDLIGRLLTFDFFEIRVVQ